MTNSIAPMIFTLREADFFMISRLGLAKLSGRELKIVCAAMH